MGNGVAGAFNGRGHGLLPIALWDQDEIQGLASSEADVYDAIL